MLFVFFILSYYSSWKCLSFALPTPIFHNANKVASTLPSPSINNNNNNYNNNGASLTMFVDALPTPMVIQGYSINPSDESISPGFLTIGMFQTQVKFHRDLPPTTVFAYGTSPKTASVPGPTIEAIAGVDTFIKWENHLPLKHIFLVDTTIEVASPLDLGVPTVAHLHGGLNDPASDGHALAWFTAGFSKKGPGWKQRVYHYRNPSELVNLLYHDHALGYTRLNMLAGLIGGYVIRNISRDINLFNIQPNHDIGLIISDKIFLKDGSIYINATGINPTIHPSWQPEYFGDVMIVNGKAWPFFNVAPEKYRFRITNACNSRFLNLAMNNGFSFTQIGSDSFYLPSPVVLKEILLAPAEIADVIIDFSGSSKTEIILTNNAPYPFPSGDPTNNKNGNLMKFIVSSQTSPQGKTAIIPSQIVPITSLYKSNVATTRYITMLENNNPNGNPLELLLNFVPFKAPITEFPRLGTTELWHIINISPDNHPFHIHLVGFQVLGEKKINDPIGNLSSCLASLKDPQGCNIWSYVNVTNPSTLPLQSEAGWKNVYKMKPRVITSLLIQFSQTNMQPFPFDATAPPGYLYHCHIVDHEDNKMMRPFKMVK